MKKFYSARKLAMMSRKDLEIALIGLDTETDETLAMFDNHLFQAVQSEVAQLKDRSDEYLIVLYLQRAERIAELVKSFDY